MLQSFCETATMPQALVDFGALPSYGLCPRLPLPVRVPGWDGGTKAMSDRILLNAIVVAGKDQVACALGEEAAILHMGSGIYYGLDPVGARVWNLLQQPQSVEEIREALVAEYEVEPDRCEADLLDLLERLRSERLIEVRDASAV